MNKMVFILFLVTFCNETFAALTDFARTRSSKMFQSVRSISPNSDRRRAFGLNSTPLHAEVMRRIKPIEPPRITTLTCQEVPCDVGGMSNKRLFELQGGDHTSPQPRFMLKLEESGGVNNELLVSKLAQETGLSGQYAVVNPHDHNQVAIFMISEAQSFSDAFKDIGKGPKFLFPKSPNITSGAFEGRWQAVRDGIFTELDQITEQFKDGQKFNLKSFYGAMALKVFVASQDIRPDNLLIDNFGTVYAIDNAMWRHAGDLQDAERVKPLEIKDDCMRARVRYFHSCLQMLVNKYNPEQLFNMYKNVYTQIDSADKKDGWEDVKAPDYIAKQGDTDYISVKPEGLQHFEKLCDRAKRILEDLGKSLTAYDAKKADELSAD